MSILDGITRFNPNKLFKRGRKRGYLNNPELVVIFRRFYMAGYNSVFDNSQNSNGASKNFNEFLLLMKKSVK